MRYKRTTRISTRAYSPERKVPLDAAQLILRQVEREEACERSFTPKIPAISLPDALKPSPGLYNLFKSNVETFVLSFRP